ncbi:MAG TPA: diacylglycerol kinase family protein [Mycobacteriales bacterium]|nr:diacylglycerol kinase family protein [Mycobacteriales bacterium]
MTAVPADRRNDQRTFDRVVLIFNPQSTGDAEEKATELRDELASRVPDLPVSLEPTERAGHARELAREAAASGAPLVVSVSGDGGYSEVVDGLMQAGNDRVVAAVLAAGNANDHRRATGERPLADAIAEGGEAARMDLLKLTSGTDVQFAHSYIGLGLTPVVAIDLEKGSKGSLKEIVSVVRTFARFRPFALDLEDGSRARLDSLVFANIDQMAKFATLSSDGDPDDGVFEVITIPHSAKWKVLLTALRAATRGLGPQPSTRSYRFRTVDPTPLQVDGEVIEVAAGTDVAVEMAAGALQELR